MILSHAHNSDDELAGLNLVDLIELKAGISLGRPQARSWNNGSEYWGPCPFCKAGRDRFHVWPDALKPRYWCRVCNRHGSAPWFLVEYCDMTYPQALAALGIRKLSASEQAALSGPSRPDRLRAAKDDMPCEAWMERAASLVHVAQKTLHSLRGAQALAYLHQRGLTDDIIDTCKLGYVPSGPGGRWLQEPLASWGLPVTSGKTMLTLFEGILIPWYVGGQIWKMEVRRLHTPSDDPHKIASIIGSKGCLYNVNALHAGQTVVLAESALDAISVMQTCPDLATAIATGGTKQAMQRLWITCLKRSGRLLIAFDNDKLNKDGKRAGDAAFAEWKQAIPYAVRAYPWSHDLNDMLREGKDIRSWLQNEIESADLADERVPQLAAAPKQPEQAAESAQQETCCICGVPARHFSPGGDSYCTEHYMCVGGHPPRWVKWRGLNVCACVVARDHALKQMRKENRKRLAALNAAMWS